MSGSQRFPTWNLVSCARHGRWPRIGDPDKDWKSTRNSKRRFGLAGQGSSKITVTLQTVERWGPSSQSVLNTCLIPVNFNSHFRPSPKMRKKTQHGVVGAESDARTSNVMHTTCLLTQTTRSLLLLGVWWTTGAFSRHYSRHRSIARTLGGPRVAFPPQQHRVVFFFSFLEYLLSRRKWELPYRVFKIFRDVVKSGLKDSLSFNLM